MLAKGWRIESANQRSWRKALFQIPPEALTVGKHDVKADRIIFIYVASSAITDERVFSFGNVTFELFSVDQYDLAGAFGFDSLRTLPNSKIAIEEHGGGVFTAFQLGAVPGQEECSPEGKRQYIRKLGWQSSVVSAVTNHELAIGMPAEAVIQSLGYPDDVKTVVTAAGKTQMWWYGSSKIVTLFNGRVVKWVE